MTVQTPALSSEKEIQSAYSGSDVAEAYVAGRFESELHRLLHDRQVASINRVMRERRPARSLEIAPGPGRVTREVIPGGDLICLEFNEGMIEQGRRTCSRVAEWVQGNAFELSFSEPFDFVYTFRFIRHFQLEDRQRLYAQIRNVLKPGGVLVFDAVCERFSKPLREARPEEYPIYDKLFRREELIEELRTAGFQIQRLEAVQKFVSLQSQSQVYVGPRAAWLNRMIIRGLDSLPRRDGLEWIVECRA